MTPPDKRALNIYLSLYRANGCEGRTKRSGRYSLALIIEALKQAGVDATYWEEVNEEFRKL